MLGFWLHCRLITRGSVNDVRSLYRTNKKFNGARFTNVGWISDGRLAKKFSRWSIFKKPIELATSKKTEVNDNGKSSILSSGVVLILLRMEDLPYFPEVLYWYYWQWKIFHIFQWCCIDITDNGRSSICSSVVILTLMTIEYLPYFPVRLYCYYWQWKIFHIFQQYCIGITEKLGMEDLPIDFHDHIRHQIKQE